MKNLTNRLARLHRIVVKLYEEEGVLSVGGVMGCVHLSEETFAKLFAGMFLETEDSGTYSRYSIVVNYVKFICVVKKGV